MITGMPSAAHPDAPDRRTVLRHGLGLGYLAAAATLTGALTGCDLRLEDGAPDLPLLQRRSIPDQVVLIASTQRSSALAQLAGRVEPSDPTASRLAQIHRSQARVVRQLLTEAKVPSSVIDDPREALPVAQRGSLATGTSSPVAVSAPATGSVADLRAAEVGRPATLGIADLVATLPQRRLLLVSIAIAERIAAALLPSGAPAPTPTTSAPTTAVATSAVATSAALAPLLTATAAAGYSLEVLAGQSNGTERISWLTILALVRDRERRLRAALGSAAPAPALGWVLPGPVGTAPQRLTVARTALGALVDTGLTGLPAPAELTAELVDAVIPWQIEAAELAARVGARMRTFPGLSWSEPG